MENPSSKGFTSISADGGLSSGGHWKLATTLLRRLLVVIALTPLGCAASGSGESPPTIGESAPTIGENSTTCELRFKSDPVRVVSYSEVAESGDSTVRKDVCRATESEQRPFDPAAILFQIDSYKWDAEAKRWTLIGAPRTQIGSCASLTEGLDIGAVAAIEQILCSETAPEESRYKINLHGAPYGCWRCFERHRTVRTGSLEIPWVYCQAHDYAATGHLHLDVYLSTIFQTHVNTFTCQNVTGLTAAQRNFLCGNPLPRLQTCGQ